ncbi:MAG: hypothetical protein GY754_28955 [bacterium]|nr:hypothetical protein [bacterium]
MGRGLRKGIKEGFVPIEKVTDTDIEEMHRLFVKYYENTAFDIFARDMRKKDGIMCFRKKVDNSIIGFSTIMRMNMRCKGKRVDGVFSGDTVLEKEYWGSGIIQISFIRYVILQKLRNPFVPFYWFLISKGYKTYLLLANNFLNHYPRCEGRGGRKNRRMKDVVEAYCDYLYPGYLDKEDGLLKFGDDYQKLKTHVAEITDKLKEEFPKIAYFEELNPTWREGTELPCIGKLELAALGYYIQKVGKNLLQKSLAHVRRIFGVKTDIAYENADRN